MQKNIDISTQAQALRNFQSRMVKKYKKGGSFFNRFEIPNHLSQVEKMQLKIHHTSLIGNVPTLVTVDFIDR